MDDCDCILYKLHTYTIAKFVIDQMMQVLLIKVGERVKIFQAQAKKLETRNYSNKKVDQEQSTQISVLSIVSPKK